MRGDGDSDFHLEVCRTALELRKPDGRRRTTQAFARARRDGDQDQAAALVKLLDDNRNRRLSVEDEGPTPETLVRRRLGNRTDTIGTLIRTGKLSWAQQAAALQISDVVEGLTASLAARGCRWEQGRIDSSGTSSAPERLAQLYRRHYQPWARWMRDPHSLFQVCQRCGVRLPAAPVVSACDCGSDRVRVDRPHLPLVLSIVVWGAGLEQCASVYRMRRQRAGRLLALGLDRYADFC
jgi:hypothetical protein